MKLCPCCGNEPIVDRGFVVGPGKYRMYDNTCRYGTIPRDSLDKATQEWDKVTTLVSQWMKDGKPIRYEEYPIEGNKQEAGSDQS